MAVYHALSWRPLTGWVARYLLWAGGFNGVSTPMKSISTSEPYFCLSNWPFRIPLAMWELMEWSEPEGLRWSSNDVTCVTFTTDRRWWSNRLEVQLLRNCPMTCASKKVKSTEVYIWSVLVQNINITRCQLVISLPWRLKFKYQMLQEKSPSAKLKCYVYYNDVSFLTFFKILIFLNFK